MRVARIKDEFAALAATFDKAQARRRHSPPREVILDVEAIGVEELEKRRLFASFAFSGGVLSAVGTTDAERFTVYRVTGPGVDEIHVRVLNLVTSVEQDSGAKATGTVSRIDVFGAAGDDDIVVESAEDISNGFTPFASKLGTIAVNKPTKLFGDGGADEIHGGDQGDTIAGGTGHDDPLMGRNGNDTIYGGAGYIDDQDINNGNDFLNGGPGNDVCYGGYGNDILTGGAGSDLLSGEYGDDQFWLNKDGERDTLDGGPGTDSAFNEWDDGGIDTLINIEFP